MTFTIENIINSLAGLLTAQYPDYPVYSSQNQQGTEAPCFFILFMPSAVEGHIGERFYRDLGIDIVFLQERNIVNGNAEIQTIAEYLDESLELFGYADENGSSCLLHTFEREWKIEDEELHYQFHIRQRVSLPRSPNTIKEMERNDVSTK